MNTSSRSDDYLIQKFIKMQQAAQQAQADIAAIPADASVDYECDAIRCALAPVERGARMIMLNEAHTAAGVIAKERAKAWLDDGSLSKLLEPLEISDEHCVFVAGAI